MDVGDSFVAVDFETATAERASACAVGVVVFENGSPIIKRRLLIRPPLNEYSSWNIAIHGITPADTRNAPVFPAVWDQIAPMIDDRLVIAHNTAFDISVLRRSAYYHGYRLNPFRFACTYRLARSSLPDAPSWKLNDLAAELGIPLDHHDPLSDATAAGFLWLELARMSGSSHTELLARCGYRLGHCHPERTTPFSNAEPKPKPKSSSRQVRPARPPRESAASKPKSKSSSFSSFSAKDFTPRRTPDPEGALFGKKVVFTGALASMPRWEAFQVSVDAGARPVTSVSRLTDYLVVGSTDLDATDEADMSSKHRKALAFARQGHSVRVIDEDQFFCLLADDTV